MISRGCGNPVDRNLEGLVGWAGIVRKQIRNSYADV